MPKFSNLSSMVGYMKRAHSKTLHIEVTARPLILWADEQSCEFVRLDCIDILQASNTLPVAVLSIVDVCHECIVPFGRGSAELDSCLLLFRLLDTSLWSQKAIFRSSSTKLLDFHSWCSALEEAPYAEVWEETLLQGFHTTLEGRRNGSTEKKRRLRLSIETTEEGIKLLNTPLELFGQLTGETLVESENTPTPGLECFRQGERLRRLLLQYALAIRNDSMEGFVFTAAYEMSLNDSKLEQTCFGGEPCVEDPLRDLQEKGLMLETAEGKRQIQEAISKRGVPLLMDVPTGEYAQRLLEQS